VTRAVAALGGEEESLRAHVARWFFDSVEGASPQDAWATRETLDFADRLRSLRSLKGREAVALLGKLDEAQRLARTNVSAALVGELVRMASPPCHPDRSRSLKRWVPAVPSGKATLSKTMKNRQNRFIDL